ncbi:MAG: hypothetical protein ACRDRA_11125, partial [Pseudonocardiaceae bacterium]
MDADPDPAVDARRRRVLLIAILAFPVIVGLATWAAAKGILPGLVQLEAPAPAVVPSVPAGPTVPGELVVQPPVEPAPLPAEIPAPQAPPQAPPPPAAVPAPDATGPAGGAGPAAGGSGTIPGGPGS